MNTHQQRVVARRMIHRSRSVATTATLSIVAVVAIWVGIESALRALRLPPLIADADTIVDAVQTGPWIAAIAGVVLAVCGLVLVVLAVTPGRRGRRVLTDNRAVIVVDDAVLAGALSRSAASAASVPPGQVSTALGRRRAEVSVAPLSGFPVAGDRVSTAVEETLRAVSPARATATRVRVAPRGRILA